MKSHSNRILNLSGLVACLMLLAIAWYMQYIQGIRPCPLCMLQRLIFMALGVILLLAALHNPAKTGSRIYAVIVLILALSGVLVAWRHIWLQLNPGVAQTDICVPGFSYLITHLPFSQALGFLWKSSENCSHIATLWGISIPVWSLSGFIAFCVLALLQLIFASQYTK